MHRRMTIGHSREKEKYFSIKKKKQNTKRQQGEGLRHSLSSVRYVNERCRTVNIIRIVVRLNSRAIHDDLLVERRSEKIMKSRKKKKIDNNVSWHSDRDDCSSQQSFARVFTVSRVYTAPSTGASKRLFDIFYSAETIYRRYEIGM